MNEQKFNKTFSAVILFGMSVSVLVASALKLGDPSVSRWLLALSVVGALSGVASTILSANGFIWTFAFGLVDAAIYSVSLGMQTPVPIGTLLLHVLYIIPMEFVGFFQWRKRGAGTTSKVRARRLDGRGWALTVLFFAAVYAATFAASWFFAVRTSSPNLLKISLDALMTTANIVAFVLMSMAYMEQWYVWTIVNLSSVVFWAVTLAGNPSSGESLVYLLKYFFYLLNGLNGIRIWYGLSRKEDTLQNP